MHLLELLAVRLSKARIGAFALLFILAVLTWGLVSDHWQSGGASTGDSAIKSAIVESAEKPALGLVTSLPIYWPETANLEDMLAEQGDVPWVRAQLEREYELVPLDVLSGEQVGVPSAQLASLNFLFLAQPSAMAPEELVALDTWVRGGGRLLLLADPMLTQESDFAHGDKRRPADMTLLGPLLTRWGLSMQFDPAQPHNERVVEVGDNPQIELPLHLAGTFSLNPNTDPDVRSDNQCAIAAEQIIALCKIGAGQALIVADAALVEQAEPSSKNTAAQIVSGIDAGRAAALSALLDEAFQ